MEGEGLAEGRAGWRWLGGWGQGRKAACSVGAPPPSAPLLPSAPLSRFASLRSHRPRRPGCGCARCASGRSLLLLARGSVLAFRPLRQSPAAYASVAAVAAAPLRAVAPRCVVARSLPPACVLALPRVGPSVAPLRSPASLRSSQSLRRRRRHCRPCKPPCIPAPTPRATASHRAPRPSPPPPPPPSKPLNIVKKKMLKFGGSRFFAYLRPRLTPMPMAFRVSKRIRTLRAARSQEPAEPSKPTAEQAKSKTPKSK